MKLRIKFSKHDAMKFIGHLDVMRYFQKAIRRSGIDIEYSGGFSPHPIMAFAAPLGVGLESDGEYFDIQVNSMSSRQDMIKKLNDQMSPGFGILDIVLLPDNASNAMASVMAASYKVSYREGRKPSFDLAQAVNRFNASDEVLITKQTKKSEITLNLKEGVFELDVDKEDRIFMLVDASSAGNIKPDLVMQALYSFYNEDMPENPYIITRLETFGRDTNNDLQPLSAFGTDF